MTDAGAAPGTVFEPDRLDDQAYLAEGDPSGVLRAVASSAARVRTAYRAAVEAQVASLARFGRPRAIVVVGTGGSAVTGDVLDAVIGYGAPLPVVTVRGHRLPGWVGAADIVMAVSRPGDGEETFAPAAEAARRGASIMGVGPARSPLEHVVTRAGGPYVPLEGEAARPGGTLWELAVPLVVAASALGLVEAGEDVFEAAAVRLEDIAHRCRPSSESFINPGKTLATELAGSVPMIWGSSPLAGAAARWLAFRLNEIAKYPAIWGEIPESRHQLAAFSGPLAGRDVFADPFADEPGGEGAKLRLVLLRDAEEQEQVVRNRTAAVGLAEDRGVPVSEVVADGVQPLERLASLIGLGDYAAVYAALGYGIDPESFSDVTELRA
ncbi:bifunctional glucose-6-phosphate/mannose-6-phosphate isomerase [Planotetraspora silvatica]|uniref:Bifunctional glucose-6-phosphate/mannose-6-phosphate isomerase n=1 Tax=Planotetraspora silvatica TaxID=234614 RepID=A0A8J3XQW9_9ACTN|nr:SIS domain-containing protein [Planotetraspora silvatica]GII49610.1 bifunctional glucose-6-phosphate/mannose-6-phosphate isomerase [Planotetraspora silvatica]